MRPGGQQGAITNTVSRFGGIGFTPFINLSQIRRFRRLHIADTEHPGNLRNGLFSGIGRVIAGFNPANRHIRHRAGTAVQTLVIDIIQRQLGGQISQRGDADTLIFAQIISHRTPAQVCGLRHIGGKRAVRAPGNPLTANGRGICAGIGISITANQLKQLQLSAGDNGFHRRFFIRDVFRTHKTSFGIFVWQTGFGNGDGTHHRTVNIFLPGLHIDRNC